MRTMNKKRLAAVAGGTAIVMAGAGIGFAYWTSSGSGTGSATTNTSHTVTLSAISVADLAPGLTKSVPFTFTNTTGNGNQNFGKASVATVVDSDIQSALGKTCTAAILDLQYTPASDAVGTVNDGETYSSDASTQPSITMQDPGTSQDECQGAIVSITVKLAQGH